MSKILRYALILSGSAFQGLQKLVIISVLFKMNGSEFAGHYATLIAIPTFISLLCGMGFGSKLLKLIPNENPLKQREYFCSILFSSLFWATLISISLIIVSFCTAYEMAIAILPYVYISSIILLIRNYYISRIDYTKLFYFDICSFFISVLVIFISKSAEEYLIYSSLFLSLVIILWYVSSISIYKVNFSFLCDKEIAQFSTNNILSAGILSLLPIALSHFFGSKVTGEVMVLINLFSVFLLLSRAFANYNIPKLVSSIKLSNNNFIKDAKSFSYHYNFMTLAFLFITVIFTFLLNLPIIAPYTGLEQTTVGSQLAILMFVFSGSFGVVQGIYLFILGHQKYSIYSNLLYFSCCIFLFLIALSNEGDFSVGLFMMVSALISALRYPYLRYYSTKFITVLN